MSEQIYNWKRFWCPRSGQISLADDGYLYVPSTWWGKAYNPHLVSFAEISDLPCLILLGEPGIGKTHALEIERQRVSETIRKNGNEEIVLDLRSFGDESRLVKKLFEHPKFTAWVESTNSLHIFLDSLDECLLRIDTVATLLADEFKEYQDKAERLFLRIACRTAVWLDTLEKGLQRIWGEDSVGVYELVPLRRADVETAATSEGIESQGFLVKVWDKNLVSLAIKPVTLKFLLNIYKRHNGQFPKNQTLCDFYLEGCRLLCEEINPNRRRSNLKGLLEPNQRLIVAARIAAVTIFANRFAVWTGIDRGEVPEEDLLLRNLSWGNEFANGRKFEVTERAIQEVLDSGLFSSRGLHRMGWAHQTYTEFLAAWYLLQNEVPLTEIVKLIFSSEDSEHKLIPQLHETAAWLASMRLDVLQEIIKTDPDVILRSDIPTDSNLRETIVNNLLIQYEQEKIYDRERSHYHNYEKLKHPGLAIQLRPYIQDSRKQIDARNTAIYIAEVCQVSELQEDLLNLVLDSSQSIHLRAIATAALCSIGSEDTKLKLKPLVIRHLSEDVDDRLKGYALQALWSDHLTADELFQVLTSPKKRNFFGSYQMFLEYTLISKLRPEDLVVALNWVEKQGLRGFGHPFLELSDAIILKAWQYFDLPNVAESFTNVALVQWREYQRVIYYNSDLQKQFEALMVNDVEKRHKLIEQAVLIASESGEDLSFLLSYHTENVLIKGDIFWMLEKLRDTASPEVQRVWVQLIQLSFNRQDFQEIDAILTVTQTNKILHEEFADYFEAVELNSAMAEKMKSHYLKMQEWESSQHTSSLLKPPPCERVLHLLDRLESGCLSAWWQLNMEMTLKPNSRYYDREFELDLTILPGWQEANDVTQNRIINGAKQFLQQQNDINYDWIGTNKYNRSDLSGCRAFMLLLQHELDFIYKISSDIWKKWAPIIVAVPSSNKRDEFYLELVKLSYLNASDEVLKTLMTLIDQENREHEYISVVDRFEKCWDERLKLALLEKTKDCSLKPKCMGQLLENLLKHKLKEAREFAKTLIIFPLPSAEDERERVFTAAKVLVENLDLSSWSLIWLVIQQDSSFGRSVFELVADRLHNIQLNLTEKQLADLYIWFVHQYPFEEDPDYSNEVLAHCVTTRERIADLRDNIILQLKERGTLQACIEIQRVIQELPTRTWLKKTLLEAQKNMRRKTWQPLQPKQVLQLTASQKDVQQIPIQIGVLDMSDKRTINTAGGNYYESINTGGGNYIQGNYINMSQDLTQAATQIQDLIEQLQKQGMTVDVAQEQVAKNIATQAQNNPTVKDKLVKWGQSLGNAAITDVVKGVVKLAIRLVGIPLP